MPAKPRRLKVFQTVIGFHDTVVAAPNQGAALAAWGVRQNLFAEGQARVTTDPAAVAAATAQPGRPLRRAVGSDAPFTLAGGLPDLPDAPKRPRPAGRSAAPELEPEPAPPPDRSALDAAEDALAELDQDEAREAAAFRRRQSALDLEKSAARRAAAKRRADAEKVLQKARRAYERAGGEP